MKYCKICFLFLLLPMAFYVSANEIELSFSDDLIDLRFNAAFEQDFSGELALLHADFEGIDTDQISYTFAAHGQRDRFDISLGLRFFLIDAEREDGYGAGLGLGIGTQIIDKVFAEGEVYYSPDILTGGDLENTLDAEVRLNYQLIDNGQLFIGYRWFEIDTDHGDFDVYDDPVIGIKFTF